MNKRRPTIPLRVQRDAAIIQIGLDPAHAELDHDPALALREHHADGSYTPDANDPHFLKWRGTAAHAEKTFGRRQGAQRTTTTAGSDIHLIAKGKRLRLARAMHDANMIAKAEGLLPPDPPAKRGIPRRANPWPPKGARPLRSRKQRRR